MNIYKKQLSKFYFFQIIFLILLFKPAVALEIIRDAEIEKLLKDYSEPLFKAAGLSTKNLNIVIISDPSLNAFATTSGKVFIHSGLLTKSKTPNEVIGILAHEIGHIKNGHAITRRSQIDKANLTSALALIAGIGATTVGIYSDNRNIGMAGQGLTMGMKNSAKRN